MAKEKLRTEDAEHNPLRVGDHVDVPGKILEIIPRADGDRILVLIDSPMKERGIALELNPRNVAYIMHDINDDVDD